MEGKEYACRVGEGLVGRESGYSGGEGLVGRGWSLLRGRGACCKQHSKAGESGWSFYVHLLRVVVCARNNLQLRQLVGRVHFFISVPKVNSDFFVTS